MTYSPMDSVYSITTAELWQRLSLLMFHFLTAVAKALFALSFAIKVVALSIEPPSLRMK